MLNHDVKIECLKLIGRDRLDKAVQILEEHTRDDLYMYMQIIYYAYCIEAMRSREIKGILDQCSVQSQINIIVLDLLQFIVDDNGHASIKIDNRTVN